MISVNVVGWFEKLLGRTPERRDREKKLDDAMQEVHDFRQQLHHSTQPVEQAEQGRRSALAALEQLRERQQSDPGV